MLRKSGHRFFGNNTRNNGRAVLRKSGHRFCGNNTRLGCAHHVAQKCNYSARMEVRLVFKKREALLGGQAGLPGSALREVEASGKRGAYLVNYSHTVTRRVTYVP